MRQYLFVSLLAEGPTCARSGRQQVRGGAGSFKKKGGKTQVEDISMGRGQSSKALDTKFIWIFLQSYLSQICLERSFRWQRKHSAREVENTRKGKKIEELFKEQGKKYIYKSNSPTVKA